jgi:hypothetical protein
MEPTRMAHAGDRVGLGGQENPTPILLVMPGAEFWDLVQVGIQSGLVDICDCQKFQYQILI